MAELDPELMRAAARQVVRDNFFAFLWRCFATLHPGNENEFVPAWHIRAMCHELDLLRGGPNKRLVITIPPRCLKSITVAVAYPAFLLCHNPGTKIIAASYGLDLARKHGEDSRRVMEAKWYREAFPDTRIASRGNTLDEFWTTRGGGRKAVSSSSAVNGHGADVIIIDDLLKGMDSTSEIELLRAQEFIEGTLLSRFDNPAEGRLVLVAQRLHEADTPGYLLDKGIYRHLNLPAIAEEEQEITLGRGKFHGREVGTALFPERLGLDVLEQKPRELGSAVFNCQYQQNTIAPNGSPLRWEWFGVYDDAGVRESFQMIVQSWDIGTSSDPRSDFSVCTTWGFRDNRWFLLDLFRAQIDFPELKKKTLELARAWRADCVLIEKAMSGILFCRNAAG